MIIENILSYSIESLFWGIVIATAVTGLFLFLVKSWSRDGSFTMVTYITGAALWVILVHNCTLINSAIEVKSDLDFYESLITQFVRCLDFTSNIIPDRRTSDDIIQRVLDEIPILGFFVGKENFAGCPLVELPRTIIESFRSDLNQVILRKSLWSVAFFAAAVIIGINTLGRSGRSSRGRRVSSRYESTRVSSRNRRSSSRRR